LRDDRTILDVHDGHEARLRCVIEHHTVAVSG